MGTTGALLALVTLCTVVHTMQCVAMPTTATGDEGGQARPRQLSGSNSLRHPRLQPRQPLHPMSAHPQSCIRPRHTNTTDTVLQWRYCDAYYFRSIMIIAKNPLNVKCVFFLPSSRFKIKRLKSIHDELRAIRRNGSSSSFNI